MEKMLAMVFDFPHESSLKMDLPEGAAFDQSGIVLRIGGEYVVLWLQLERGFGQTQVINHKYGDVVQVIGVTSE